MQIPLEDLFEDIIGKAQRGLALSDAEVESRAGLQRGRLAAMRKGEFSETDVLRLAPVLELHPTRLLSLARREWQPEPVSMVGLQSFNTRYSGMTVNSYIVWDGETQNAAVFDTGADANPVIDFARKHGLSVELILLTHTHIDHIVALPRLTGAFPQALVFAHSAEGMANAQAFQDGRAWTLGRLTIEARHTAGHSPGGTTFVVRGLERTVAIVGDALFAGSVGGAAGAWRPALSAIQKKILSLPDDAVLCPGHGPVTTVAEEKAHNPMFP